MTDLFSVYIPMDRRQALSKGVVLPELAQGAGLFADVSGFTALTEALVDELGDQRASEELTHHLNLVYDALIAELHTYGGSVINFAGDAITCWLNEDDGLRAAACALAMQRAMLPFNTITIPSGRTVSLTIKIAVVTGTARRFVVGDPQIRSIDVLAGQTLDRLAAANHHAQKGEVIVDAELAATLSHQLQIMHSRKDEDTGNLYSIVSGLQAIVEPAPWPSLSSDILNQEQIRPWLLPVVYNRLQAGQGELLSELRPVVVLFLRFSGIDYDADDRAGEKLDSFIREVQRIFARYEGALLQVIIGDKGSSLYAAFGAPSAHEDDAARAVSAALELRASPVPTVNDIQIGISLGRMLTGAYGGATCRTYGVLGDEVNLAARLMEAAPVGQILASGRVQQKAGDAFSWEDLPPLKVRGKNKPVPVARPLGMKTYQGFHPHESLYALPMVGRQAELNLIEQKLEQALNGQGQIIGITGEAGLGKSRLIAEAIHRASERRMLGYGGSCESYGTATDYLVWRSIWQDFFELDSTWPLNEQIRFLNDRLTHLNPWLIERLPLLGDVLNLAIPDNDLTRSLDPKLRKTAREAMLVDCLRAQARTRPIFIMLEDCHWLDPLSYDLLKAIEPALTNLPVFMIMAYRPRDLSDTIPAYISNLPNSTELVLGNFSAAESAQLIRIKLKQVFGADTEPIPELLTRITARAEGNPFYIEELLNYLRDRNIDPSNVAAFEELDLPESLHSLILSRIDQLSESQRSTLKVAAVVGRLFRAAILWHAYPQLGAVNQILEDLKFLSRIELTLVDSEPELTYLFRHIVTHEVSYQSLPYNTRSFLHNEIAQYIEKTYAQDLGQWVYLLAYHYKHSENTTKQREYFLKAGVVAQATYANINALNYYQDALPLLSESELSSTMFQIGRILELIGKWPEADEHYKQVLVLASQKGNRQLKGQAQTAIAELLRKQGNYPEATTWYNLAQAEFEQIGDQAGKAYILTCLGTIATQQGKLAEAQALYNQGLIIRRALGYQTDIAKSLSNLGLAAQLEGDYGRARALQEESLAIRRALGDKWGIAIALNNLGYVAFDLNALPDAQAWLEEAVTIQRGIGDKQLLANALNNLGNVRRAQGEYSIGIQLYNESLRITYELGDKWALAYLLEDIGCMASLRNQAEQALWLVGSASAIRDTIGAPLTSTEKDKLESLLAPARQALGEAASEAALARGRITPLEEAIEKALEM